MRLLTGNGVYLLRGWGSSDPISVIKYLTVNRPGFALYSTIGSIISLRIKML